MPLYPCRVPYLDLIIAVNIAEDVELRQNSGFGIRIGFSSKAHGGAIGAHTFFCESRLLCDRGGDRRVQCSLIITFGTSELCRRAAVAVPRPFGSAVGMACRGNGLIRRRGLLFRQALWLSLFI